MPEVLRASCRSGVLIIPRSARLLNLEGCLIDATGYAPGLPSLCAQFLCLRKTFGAYPAYYSRYCFSYLPDY